MDGKKVAFGIIGVGNMGKAHASFISTSQVCELKAVCDNNPAAFDRLPENIRSKVTCYTDAEKFLSDPAIDAVLIAVPHYFHVDLAIQALEHGKHIIVEKPISVHKKEAERLLKAAEKYPHLVQSIMFNQRTLPAHIKLKQLLDSGELGQLRRINWIVTDWFRTQFYYDSGDWRASWRGEGGGVLLNQCPHQLDLMQWFFGMPCKVRAAVKLGKYHNIEVEDEINAYLEYADGKSANFISTTGEAPGINRLEVVGERGLLTLENNQITFRRNVQNTSEYSQTAKAGFTPPECWECKIPIPGAAVVGHLAIIENTAKAIQKQEELKSPLAEGIRGLELGNAILYSGLKDQSVEMPLDADAYAEMLDGLIAESKWDWKKPVQEENSSDFGSSF